MEENETHVFPNQNQFTNENTQNQRDLSIFSKICFGFGHIFNDLCIAIWGSYLLLFLEKVLLMPGGAAGGLILFGQIIDATTTPIAGYLCDRFGAKRKLHILGTIIVFISFPLVYSFCPMCQIWPNWWRYVYFAIAIMLFQIGWPLVQITHLALIFDITSTQKDRKHLLVVRIIAQAISGLIIFEAMSMVFGMDIMTPHSQIGPKDTEHFRAIALIITSIGGCASIIFHISLCHISGSHRLTHASQSVPNDIGNSNEANDSEIQQLISTEIQTVDDHLRRNFFKELAIYQNCLLHVFARIFSTIAVMYIPLWLNGGDGSGHLKMNVTAVPLISYFASFLSIYLLIRWLGHRTKYLFGVLMGIAGCVIVETSPTSISDTRMYLIGILIGASGAITTITSLFLIADMVGENTKQSGFIFSIVTTIEKIMTGVMVLLLEILRDVFKDNHQYYKQCISRVCGGAAVFGGFTLGIFSSIEFFRKHRPRFNSNQNLLN